MTLILVGLNLFLTQLDFGQALKIPYPDIVVIPPGDQVDFLCQHHPTEGGQFNLTLLRRSEEYPVCVLYTNGTDLSLHNWKDQAPCHLRNSSGTMSFSLSNLDTNHIDMYICHLEIYFPPPFVNSTFDKTYIYVYEPKPENLKKLVSLLMWIFMATSIFLFIFCIVTVYLLIRKRQPKKSDPINTENNNEHNGVYMPMAPVTVPRCPTLDVSGRNY
ncbi:cytotoxic T-lymphocyte protein 4 [Discoglossus pictus]